MRRTSLLRVDRSASRQITAICCCTLSPVRSDHDILAGLSRSYLFEGMTRDQIEPLAAVTKARELVRGEHLCQIGDPADEIFVMMSGECVENRN